MTEAGTKRSDGRTDAAGGAGGTSAPPHRRTGSPTRFAHTIALMLAIAFASAACSDGTESPLTGYVEGEFALVASPFGGTLERLAVQRGDRVKEGDALFAIDSAIERAAAEEARSRVQSAQASIENLSASRRAAEIDALRQRVAAVRASLDLSEETLRNQTRLRGQGFVSQQALDAARAARDRDAAQLREAQAQVRTAQDSIGREPEIAAARAQLEAARAAYEQARERVEQKSPRAPAGALVADTYFRVGESVPAGAPVVSLLPPGAVKLRFFVPQARLGTLRIGDAVRAHCDGCDAPIEARIVFVSPRAEYTPPVIYGEHARQKLVFLVEAKPSSADAPRLHPGQPVDILSIEADPAAQR